ncbi:hypothetical protein CLOP_g2104 [Closterium sp. NIES-67]|nr:hypothetical protein CLOP_g2104 [Closterium sp. NIES-67]
MGWAQGAECAQAQAITCDRDGMVTSLDLNRNNFTGPIFNVVSNMPSLVDLKLYHNRFTGPIPPAISRLHRLTHLYASANTITGSIPTALAALPRLKFLSLSQNPITGSLPDALSRLTALEHLTLSETSITGQLPRSLSALTRLTTLDLLNMKLQGSIPATFGALTNLVSLYFSGATCPLEGSCEINQNRSSVFCRICSTFCSSCIPINGQDHIKHASSEEGERMQVRPCSSPLRALAYPLLTSSGPPMGGQRGGGWGEAGGVTCTGGSLETMLQSPGASPLSLRQRVDILVGVLRALKAVQSHGLVHGDLKPSNVLLGAAYEPRVGDWSLVRMGQRVHQEGSLTGGIREDSEGGSRGGSSSSSGHWTERSRNGVSAGGVGQASVLRCTEGHVDPMVLQSGLATATADMYSVGVVLLQLLTGWAAPFKLLDGQRTHICASGGFSGGALGRRLAMLGAEDSREFVV